MAYRPETVHADRDGNKVRLFPDSQNVVLGGALAPIDEVLKLTSTGNGFDGWAIVLTVAA